VDVASIISIVTMNYEEEKDIYWLDCIDANSLDEFMTNKILWTIIFFISITFHAFVFALTSKLF